MNKVVVEIEFADVTLGLVAEVMRRAQAAGARVRISTGGVGVALLRELEDVYGVKAEALPKAGR